jgi:hypothetical protein
MVLAWAMVDMDLDTVENMVVDTAEKTVEDMVEDMAVDKAEEMVEDIADSREYPMDQLQQVKFRLAKN